MSFNRSRISRAVAWTSLAVLVLIAGPVRAQEPDLEEFERRRAVLRAEQREGSRDGAAAYERLHRELAAYSSPEAHRIRGRVAVYRAELTRDLEETSDDAAGWYLDAADSFALSGDSRRQARARGAGGWYLGLAGRHDEALRELRTATSIAELTDDVAMMTMMMMTMMMMRAVVGVARITFENNRRPPRGRPATR